MKIYQIEENIDFKKLIKSDEKCISQVIDYVPKDVIVNQACEILFYYYSMGYKLKYRLREIFFLIFLYDSKNIKEILNRISNSTIKYNIKCCVDDKINFVERLDKDTRLKLSRNAIESMDSLL